MKCCDNIQIYNLLTKQTGTLIIDCRPAKEYERLRLKYPLLVHIPDELFEHQISLPIQCDHHQNDKSSTDSGNRDVNSLLKDIETKLDPYERCIFRDRQDLEIVLICDGQLSYSAALLSELLHHEANNATIYHLKSNFESFAASFEFMVNTRFVQFEAFSTVESSNSIEFDRLFLQKQRKQLIIEYPNCVLENELYLGNRRQACDRTMLVEMGITHVVRFHDTHEDEVILEEDKYDRVESVQYLDVAVDDRLSADISIFLQPCLQFYQDAIRNDKCRVLVHCNRGISRSTTLVLCILMKYKAYNLREALEYVKSCRRSAQPNFTFMKSLIKFEYSLLGKNSIEENELPNMNAHYNYASSIEPGSRIRCNVM